MKNILLLLLLALMVSLSGFNFINVLRAAFAHADPKSAKKSDNLIVLAAQRMLMKLTPGLRSKTNPEVVVIVAMHCS